MAAIIDHDPPLYLAGGFATARAFLAEQLEESQRTARRMMRVAKYASPAEESRYGVSRIDAPLDLLEARTHGPPEDRIPVDFGRLRIPLHPAPRTGARSLPFAQATVIQIRAATRQLTKASTRRGKRSPEERAIAMEIAKGALAEVTVNVRQGIVSLANMPIDVFGHLRVALAKANLPTNI